jgi:hypothetical protein
MSHFAELDNNNKVIRVLVCDNNDAAGDEGYSWCVNTFGGTWIKTSYNGNIRYNFAGIDYTYDSVDDAFIAPMPECGHNEVLLNNLKRWECSTCEAAFEQSRNSTA